ncbi:MAG TPA: DUF192 domain-containing protein [Candidatus Limnocylindrales bacterium]|nr:DUF192 domain-containing protein [Candidatus Limnocylindrales bacterium]
MPKNGDDKQFCRLFILLSALMFLFTMAGCQVATPANGSPEGLEADGRPHYEVVILGGREFKLELALTRTEREEGLMWREYIAEDGGMLFVFPDRELFPRPISFWMKNCLVPIDVIFIKRNGTITAIHAMQPPLPDTPDEDLPTYASNAPVQFAIELRGGLSFELGLEVGDVVDLRSDYLRALAE